MTWEDSAYKEHYANISEKFAKETADHLAFMEQRHKCVTLDYIATIEHDNKVKASRIAHLEKILKDNGIKDTVNFSPCEHSTKGTINFIPNDTGLMERIEAKRNAVIIDYFDEVRDSEGNMKRVITIECKDESMKQFLLDAAQRLIHG